MDKKKKYMIALSAVLLGAIVPGTYIWKRKRDQERLNELYDSYQEDHDDLGYESEIGNSKRKYIKLEGPKFSRKDSK